MNAAFTLLVLTVALLTGGEVNAVERLSFCAGADVTLKCGDSRQIASLDVSVYSSPAARDSCKESIDLPRRKDLCRDESQSAAKEALVENIYSKCINNKECFLSLPAHIATLKDCSGKAFFYGIQVDFVCSANAGLKMPSSKIYRRSIPRSDSRDYHDTSYNRYDKKSQPDFKSRESKASRGRDLYKSPESNFNSFESKHSKGNSRNDENSDEFRRGGSQRKNGGSGKYSGGGYSGGGYSGGRYSGTGSQIGSGAVQVSAITTLLLIPFAAIVLFR